MWQSKVLWNTYVIIGNKLSGDLSTSKTVPRVGYSLTLLLYSCYNYIMLAHRPPFDQQTTPPKVTSNLRQRLFISLWIAITGQVEGSGSHTHLPNYVADLNYDVWPLTITLSTRCYQLMCCVLVEWMQPGRDKRHVSFTPNCSRAWLFRKNSTNLLTSMH